MPSSFPRNIIYIHTHDMGRYISPYGYAIPTPHLQAFAAKATLFRQAYCCGPTCSPSRAGLLTGVTPHESGMLGLAHRGFKLTHPEFHLGDYLRRNGFLTALCGIQHEFNSAREQMPYERVYDARNPEGFGATDRAWTQAAIHFLNEKHERPFFLSYGLFYPHRPFETANDALLNPAYIRAPEPLPNTEDIRRDMTNYHYTVKLADACLGEVFETLQNTGRDRDSLIIVTTDHGIAFPSMKCHLTDHGIGVTLLMAYPGNPSSGQACDALVSHLDVYPTICDLLGVPPPEHLRGVSLRPLMEGALSSVRDEIFSEVNFHAAYEPMRCVRTSRYKLIRRYGFSSPRMSNCDASPSKKQMMRLGWASATQSETELFDLMLDSQEMCNRAGDLSLQAVREDLERRLADWMKRTNDPLLYGRILPPAGARVNRPEAVDPESDFEPIAT